jgi:cysteine desulfurase / selenocysteine lyase
MNKNLMNNLVAGKNTPVPLANGKLVPSINFDNAATTPPFLSVLNDIMKFSPYYSSVNRGDGYKSRCSTEIYENTRQLIQDFVHSDPDHDVVIYAKNTTEYINVLSYVLASQKDHQNVVLSTWMEHASNDLPWKGRFIEDYIEIDSKGRLSMRDLEKKLIHYDGAVKLVTVTGAANVTGYLNPIHKIAVMAHKYGAKIMVDGAQLVPHVPVDMMPVNDPRHIDFLAFSAHKMYAPFGIGVLIGPKQYFERSLPLLKGGSTFHLYTHHKIEWSSPPAKEEAGSPNVIGVLALNTAIRTLNYLNMNKIFEHEEELYRYTRNGMQNIPDIVFYSSSDKNDTISILPFNMTHLSHQVLASILTEEFAIAVRDGFFCAHPYCQRLLGLTPEDMEYYFIHEEAPLPGMVRISFGLYNTFDEVDIFLNALYHIAKNKQYYLYKYQNVS